MSLGGVVGSRRGIGIVLFGLFGITFAHSSLAGWPFADATDELQEVSRDENCCERKGRPLDCKELNLLHDQKFSECIKEGFTRDQCRAADEAGTTEAERVCPWTDISSDPLVSSMVAHDRAFRCCRAKFEEMGGSGYRYMAKKCRDGDDGVFDKRKQLMSCSPCFSRKKFDERGRTFGECRKKFGQIACLHAVETASAKFDACPTASSSAQ